MGAECLKMAPAGACALAAPAGLSGAGECARVTGRQEPNKSYDKPWRLMMSLAWGWPLCVVQYGAGGEKMHTVMAPTWVLMRATMLREPNGSYVEHRVTHEPC